jgi:hypothetical protein
MKSKYSITIDNYLKSGSYRLIGEQIESEGYKISYPDYDDWANILSQYYDSKSFVEESEEQKTARLAREMAEKRNEKLNQILPK